jgi:hypothetical protein
VKPCFFDVRSVLVKEKSPLKDETIVRLFKHLAEADPGTKVVIASR